MNNKEHDFHFYIIAILVALLLGLGLTYATAYFLNWLVSLTGISHYLVNTKNIFIGLIICVILKSFLCSSKSK